MGVDVDFAPGPVIADPIRSAAQVAALRVPDPRESVPFVFEIQRTLRRELASREIPLLGFAGAPFTLAAYLVEGGGSRHFGTWKRMLWQAPDVARSLLATLTELTVGYLAAQIEAGAQAVQLFDTWAGMLSPAEYREWVQPSHREIAAKLDRAAAPLILYVNDEAHVLEETAESGADVISLDWRVDLADAARRVGQRVSLQGNLDPCALAAPPETIARLVADLARDAAPARGHILNLGPTSTRASRFRAHSSLARRDRRGDGGPGYPLHRMSASMPAPYRVGQISYALRSTPKSPPDGTRRQAPTRAPTCSALHSMHSSLS
jgi:uroporphyrinogen decarboxylase